MLINHSNYCYSDEYTILLYIYLIFKSGLLSSDFELLLAFSFYCPVFSELSTHIPPDFQLRAIEFGRVLGDPDSSLWDSALRVEL